MSEETKVQESTNAEETTSSQPIAKPNVGCSLDDLSADEKRYLGSAVCWLLNDLSSNIYRYRPIPKCDVKITIELPKDDFEKFAIGFRNLFGNYGDPTDFLYTGMRFSFKSVDELKVS